jgi:hypothetical protein
MGLTRKTDNANPVIWSDKSGYAFATYSMPATRTDLLGRKKNVNLDIVLPNFGEFDKESVAAMLGEKAENGLGGQDNTGHGNAAYEAAREQMEDHDQKQQLRDIGQQIYMFNKFKGHVPAVGIHQDPHDPRSEVAVVPDLVEGKYNVYKVTEKLLRP